MKLLLDHLTEAFTRKSSCTVFENNGLSRVFPADKSCLEKRKAAIHAFAAANGFTAAVSAPGIRVTFKKIAAQVVVPLPQSAP